MPGSNYDRDLSVKEGFVLSKFLVKWEMILVYILILLNLVLLIFEPQLFFQAGTIQTIINSGFDSSPLVLGMVFILLLGDIDVSVAAQIVLGGMVTGLMMDAGIPSIICGPGDIARAHGPDEFILLSELNDCMAMLRGLGADLCRDA